jgi:hypothetical protein
VGQGEVLGLAVIGILAYWAFQRSGGQTWTPGFASSEQQGNPVPSPPDIFYKDPGLWAAVNASRPPKVGMARPTLGGAFHF